MRFRGKSIYWEKEGGKRYSGTAHPTGFYLDTKQQSSLEVGGGTGDEQEPGILGYNIRGRRAAGSLAATSSVSIAGGAAAATKNSAIGVGGQEGDGAWCQYLCTSPPLYPATYWPGSMREARFLFLRW